MEEKKRFRKVILINLYVYLSLCHSHLMLFIVFYSLSLMEWVDTHPHPSTNNHHVYIQSQLKYAQRVEVWEICTSSQLNESLNNFSFCTNFCSEIVQICQAFRRCVYRSPHLPSPYVKPHSLAYFIEFRLCSSYFGVFFFWLSHIIYTSHHQKFSCSSIFSVLTFIVKKQHSRTIWNNNNLCMYHLWRLCFSFKVWL